MELKIEYVPVDTLKPYENNAKVHTAEQIEQIKKSIEDYGMNDAIGGWHDTIVEGHGRYMACLELGYTEVPVTRLDHLTDEQRREYMLVHNQTTMNTGYDLDLLALELDELANFDAEAFGFDGDAIQIEDIDLRDLENMPEEPFAHELGEANNYIVLEFNTEADWEVAQDVFNLQRVQTNEPNPNVRKHGIGRVIDGAEVLVRLQHED